MPLFYVERRAAADHGHGPGEFYFAGSAVTLADARALEKKVYAEGWVNTRIAVNIEEAERLRALAMGE